MNLQPSTSTIFNERRELFSQELNYGGHGQLYFSTAATYTPPTGYVFYKIDFLTATTVNAAVFRSKNSTGTTIYSAGNFQSPIVFPALYSWTAPLTSVTIGGTGGTGIMYMYKKFIPEELVCGG